MDELNKLSQSELNTKLDELKALFDEVEEERQIVLGQENLHLHAAIAKNYEDELKDLGEKISRIETLLK